MMYLVRGWVVSNRFIPYFDRFLIGVCINLLIRPISCSISQKGWESRLVKSGLTAKVTVADDFMGNDIYFQS